jgi:hypothetical protein
MHDAVKGRWLDSLTLNEAQTRALQIDPQVRAADWKLDGAAPNPFLHK